MNTHIIGDNANHQLFAHGNSETNETADELNMFSTMEKYQFKDGMGSERWITVNFVCFACRLHCHPFNNLWARLLPHTRRKQKVQWSIERVTAESLIGLAVIHTGNLISFTNASQTKIAWFLRKDVTFSNKKSLIVIKTATNNNNTHQMAF